MTPKAALPILWAILALCGCKLFSVSDSDDDDYKDFPKWNGRVITDSIAVIDDFHFSEAACAELIPEDFANRPLPDTGRVPKLIVNSIACYKAKVVIENDTGAVVDSFAQVFGIWGQKDGEKEKGHLGYLIWEPSDSLSALPRQTYSWHITLDFGKSQTLKLVALVDWPVE
jgi:hypothetical protein